MLQGNQKLRLQRQCGTCRFYQPSPLEGAGWCRNLLRVSTDDLVLVRRWELACRNGWGKDDWQPAEHGRAPEQPAHARRTQSGPPSGPQFRSTVRPEQVEPWSRPSATSVKRPDEETKGYRQRPDMVLSLSRDSLLPHEDLQLNNGSQDADQIKRQWRQAALAEHPGKRCANCAFFASTAPGKGTCRNRFAFDRDTIVAPEDLACLSTLGHWWQPRSHLLLRQEALDEARRHP